MSPESENVQHDVAQRPTTDPDHKRGMRWVQSGSTCPECGSDDVFWNQEGGGCNSCFIELTFDR